MHTFVIMTESMNVDYLGSVLTNCYTNEVIVDDLETNQIGHL